MKKSIAWVLCSLFFAGIAHAAVSTDEILKKVDAIRNPSESYRMKVRVKDESSNDVSEFEVSLRGNSRTFVKTVSPARDRGRNLLMLDEEMWAYIPNLKRAVRVSLNQKLSGQAANGDISRMRWSGDYDAEIESETPAEWTLLLTAKKKGLTYEKVRAWVDKKTYHPIRAEFLSLAGKILKRASYGDYKMLAGKLRPTTIEIQDAVRESDRSRLEIQEMDVREFPESLFNQNSLR